MIHANPTGWKSAARRGAIAGIAATGLLRSAGLGIWLIALTLLLAPLPALADGLNVTVLVQVPSNPIPRTEQVVTYRIQTQNFDAGGEQTTIGVGIDVRVNGVTVSASSGRFTTSQCIVDPQFPNFWACNDLQEGASQDISFAWIPPEPGTSVIEFRGFCQVIPPPAGGFEPCTIANSGTVTTIVENQPPNGVIGDPEGDVTISAGTSLSFTSTAFDPDGDPVNFLWNFDGADQDSTIPNPEPVTFTTAGVFNVTLTVTDIFGATDPTPDSRTITVLGAPTASLNAAPSTIPQGGSSTLTWGSANATTCTGTGFNTGGATSGTASVSPNVTTTFSVTCTNAGGANSAPATATVTVGAGISATLSAAPILIQLGGSSTLTWGSSANATSCTGAGFGTGGATSGSVAVSPNATTTFSVTCSGAAGAVSPPATATVTVGPAVTASLTASPDTIPSGGSSTLTWNSSSATSCTGTNFNTGGATSGNVVVSPNNSINFSVTCSGAGGATSAPANATVTVGAGVVASLSASPDTIPLGGSSTLTWGSSANATSCTGTGFGTGGATSGTASVSPVATTDFSVTCSGAAGAMSDPATAMVTVGAPVTASLSADPNTIPMGGSSTLTWDSANATSCVGTGFGTGGATSGSVDVSPEEPTTFTVTCNGAGGAISAPAAATVTVGAAVAASLSASPLAIPSGGSSTLTWDSASATTCTGTGFNTGGATTGDVDVSPQQTTTFSVTCSGAGGATSPPAEATVTVGQGVAASLSASPLAIPLGGSSTLTWDSANATSCAGTGFGTGGATSGSADVSPQETTTFSVTCSAGGANSAPAEATVTVGAEVVASLSADPDTIESGGSSTLTWGSANAESCEGSGFDTDDDTSGSVDVSPEETTTFSVTCTGGAGGTSEPASVTVTVSDVPVCGDEVIDPGEECDDGNTRNGDGCSSVCTTEELVEFDDWAEDLEFVGDHILVAAQSAGLQLVEFSNGLFGDVRAFDPARCDGSGSPEFFVEDVEVSDAGQAYMALGPCGVGMLRVDEFIDSDDDPEMTLVPIEGWVEDIHVVGDTAYVAAFEGGLVMLDVTSPGLIEVLGTAGFASPDGFGAAIDVEVAGDIAYVATTRGLRVVDVSDPASPEVIGRIQTDPDSAPAQDVEVADFEGRTVAFLSTWESGLELIDVTDPSAPSRMAEPVASRDASLEATVAGSTVFLADGRRGLRTFAVLPSEPFLDEGRRFPTPGVLWDVDVRDGFAVVAFGENPDGDQSGGLVSVDVGALALTATDVTETLRMDEAGPVTCGRFCARVDGTLEWTIKGIGVEGADPWELDLALDDDGRWIGQDGDGNLFSGTYEKKKRRRGRKKFVLRFNTDSKSRLLEVLEGLAAGETGAEMALGYRETPKLKLSRHKGKVKLKGLLRIEAVGDDGAPKPGAFEVRRATGPIR